MPLQHMNAERAMPLQHSAERMDSLRTPRRTAKPSAGLVHTVCATLAAGRFSFGGSPAEMQHASEQRTRKMLRCVGKQRAPVLNAEAHRAPLRRNAGHMISHGA